MASFDDLGRALRDDAAANAPAASVIDVDAVTRAARARRRPRQWALGTLSVVAALGLGGLALSSITPPAMMAASESADSADLLSTREENAAGQADESTRSQPIVACGDAVEAPAASTEGWMLDARLPASAPATGSTVEGVVAITNTGDRVVSITTRPVVGGVLARDGVLVGSGVVIGDVGVATDLGPGESRELPLRVETTACTDGAPLVDGEYQVLVALEIVDASGSTDSFTVSTEIPLRLE